MSYQIVENDVRLLRRILVALQIGEEHAATEISRHLRGKGLSFKLPKEQAPGEYHAYIDNRFSENEVELVEKYECILLPNYADCIFLNSKWRNPRTLYVRLVEDVPELGDLGYKYWIPDTLVSDEVPHIVWPEVIFIDVPHRTAWTDKVKQWINKTFKHR